MENQNVTPEEIRKIRDLDEFDMIMLVSEIHDHGWDLARRTLARMPEGKRAQARLLSILGATNA